MQSSIAEAALDAWVACEPEGFVLDAHRLVDLLPTIASHVPNRSPGARFKDLVTFFTSSRHGDLPIFIRLLRVQEGRVHFMYFWKAFSEAARIADTSLDDGLTTELETLRDGLLRLLEGANCQDVSLDMQEVSTSALIGELHRTASMSAYPRFWSAAAEVLAGQIGEEQLGADCVTSIMFTWLREAAVWEQELAHSSNLGIWADLQQWLSPKSQGGLPVWLHIYDVSQSEGIQKLNWFFANKNALLKLGGVFHAGVEVNGLEWSFGFCINKTGVTCTKPRVHREHHYRQSVELRSTRMSPDEITHLISELVEDYPGDSYDLLRRNCCHFADDFCIRLGVGNIPGWVYRLARIGANVDVMLQTAGSMWEKAQPRNYSFYRAGPHPRTRPHNNLHVPPADWNVRRV
jgi:hypothetical protein